MVCGGCLRLLSRVQPRSPRDDARTQLRPSRRGGWLEGRAAWAWLGNGALVHVATPFLPEHLFLQWKICPGNLPLLGAEAQTLAGPGRTPPDGPGDIVAASPPSVLSSPRGPPGPWHPGWDGSA